MVEHNPHRKEVADVGTEHEERKDPAEDLELSAEDAGSVKGGRIPIEGGGGVSVDYRFLSKSKKKKNKSGASPKAGGRPV